MTLDYGKYGIFLIMGNAGSISSTVSSLRTRTPCTPAVIAVALGTTRPDCYHSEPGECIVLASLPRRNPKYSCDPCLGWKGTAVSEILSRIHTRFINDCERPTALRTTQSIPDPAGKEKSFDDGLRMQFLPCSTETIPRSKALFKRPLLLNSCASSTQWAA